MVGKLWRRVALTGLMTAALAFMAPAPSEACYKCKYILFVGSVCASDSGGRVDCVDTTKCVLSGANCIGTDQDCDPVCPEIQD
jgi:hypothetical protein